MMNSQEDSYKPLGMKRTCSTGFDMFDVPDNMRQNNMTNMGHDSNLSGGNKLLLTAPVPKKARLENGDSDIISMTKSKNIAKSGATDEETRGHKSRDCVYIPSPPNSPARKTLTNISVPVPTQSGSPEYVFVENEQRGSSDKDTKPYFEKFVDSNSSYDDFWDKDDDCFDLAAEGKSKPVCKSQRNISASDDLTIECASVQRSLTHDRPVTSYESNDHEEEACITNRLNKMGENKLVLPPQCKVHHEPSVGNETLHSGAAPSTARSESIQKDIETISSFIPSMDKSLIYERLVQKTTEPNRVEVVTNELLEYDVIDLTGDVPETTPMQPNDIEDVDLFSDVPKVLEIVQKEKPNLMSIDPNEVYVLLEANVSVKDRVKKVAMILLTRKTQGEEPMNVTEQDVIVQDDKTGDNILAHVQEILKEFPKEDPNLLFEMLESKEKVNDRVQLVINEIRARNETDAAAMKKEPGVAKCVVASDKDSSGNGADGDTIGQVGGNKVVDNDDLLKNNPLYQNLQEIGKMFPNVDRNEIYAYLEAHHDKPNRVQIVIEELLQMQDGSQPNSVPDTAPAATYDGEAVSVTDGPRPSNNTITVMPSAQEDPAIVIPEADQDPQNLGPLLQMEKDVETLRAIFPDCDPNYLFETIEQTFNDPMRVARLSAQMFETKNYPKLKDRQEKEKREQAKKRLLDMEFNMTDFLQMFEDPIKTFNDDSKPVSENYRAHALAYLNNYFPMLHATYIKDILETHKGHFAPTVRDLEQVVREHQAKLVTAASAPQRGGRGRRRTPKDKRFRKNPRPSQEPLPDVPDEYFYKEVLFTKHVQEIKDYLENREKLKAKKVEEAKQKGELLECGCCFDDEVLFDDMSACPDGHLFCNECVRRSSEEVIGQAKIHFPCLSGDCKAEFATSTLQKVLSSKMFSNLLRKIQEEEIRQADIPDLVSCPFCSFATIMENPDDKVFRCLNPECLKESCRLCKEPNHIPLRCEEVEKQGETNMRTYIESKMTEAMIRTCWKCNKRFFKVEGCNKMTCTCGASMCYICRKPIQDYSHFGNGPGQCPQGTDVYDLHRQEMEKAADEARKKFEEEHPDAAGTALKYDPMKALKDTEEQGGQDQLFMRRQNQPGMFPPGMPNIGFGHFNFGQQIPNMNFMRPPFHFAQQQIPMAHQFMGQMMAPPYLFGNPYMYVQEEEEEEEGEEDALGNSDEEEGDYW